jgi:Mg-chelatase subunit ChlD
MRMLPQRQRQRGIALAYVGIFLVMLALIVGLAVDLGRAYAVRLELAKAVDAAALAAARVIPNGESLAEEEAKNIFSLNFPPGYLGVTSLPDPIIEFDRVESGPNLGAHLINVSASAVLPTTFMRVRDYETIDVSAAGQATRRLVDMSFIIDHSGSLGSDYDEVQDAAIQFVNFFDADNDRMALIFFASDAVVAEPINTAGRGFDRASIVSHIEDSAQEGKTATAEGLFRGWDQLRLVPPDIQSGLRVIVLFTDGAPNVFSGAFRRRTSNSSSASFAAGTATGAIKVSDFPDRGGTSINTPVVEGLWPISSPCCNTIDDEPACISPGCWAGPNNTSGQNYTNGRVPGIPHLPNSSLHTGSSSSGIPTSFPLQTNGLAAQRTLVLETSGTTIAQHRYPSHAQNVAKASRNLAERIANEIRNDASGAHPIHIFTLGLGGLLNEGQGFPAETGSSILRRIANDPASSDYNATQPEGQYYFAGDPSQLDAAFQQIRDQIIRISE